MVMNAADGGGGVALPPDLELNTAAAAANAASTSKDSYDITLKLPLTRADRTYSFWFTYVYQDPETQALIEGPRSPVVEHGFEIPNLTKGVLNLTLIQGFKSYGVKFDIDPTSVQEDIVIFESLTGSFAGEEYIVYVGNSTNVTINTSNFAPRWVKVRTRDKWLTKNYTDTIASVSITPKNADPDTSTPPSAPSTGSAVGSIDVNDKSGFSGKMTVSWTANTDTNTSGYVIRWSSQDPAVITSPLWEYGQVDGRTTTTFEITGLTPNTRYYWQLTAKSPYNAISWTSPRSGTIAPIIDSNAPADVFAQLRSVLSIGGKTADLFKIGTGIAQSINTSITTTPALTAGTYNGIILDRSSTNYGHNYWLNTGQFRVGSATSFLFWSGSDLYTTGKITATGGSFTGDVQLNGGSLYAGALPNTGARVRLNSSGLFAYDANNAQTVAITQSDGKIDARQGYIGGWTINGTAQTTGSISSSNTKLESNGTITLGDTTGTLNSVVKLSATDTYRIWVGSQSSSVAKFRVDSTGKLFATGAQIDGTTTIGATAASDVVSNASKGATALQPNGTLTGDVTGKVNGVAVATVTSGAALGAAAIQAGNGVGIDSATKYINTIDLNSSGIVIKTSAATTKMQLTNAGLELFKSGTRTVFIDAATGNASFAGDITGATGTFYGNVNLVGSSWLSSPGVVISNTSLFSQALTSSLYAGSLTLTNAGINSYFMVASGAGGEVQGSMLLSSDRDIHLFGVNSGSGAIYANRTIALGIGSTNVLSYNAGNLTRIFADGRIFADSLNVAANSGNTSGTSIVQNSSGFLKVLGSSRRFKENIVEISKAGYLDAVLKINPVNFTYKNTDENVVEPVQSGLIAEELDLIPEFKGVVNYDLEGLPLSISYDRLSALLVLAIKEISDRLDAIGA
jgi:hypothetical protein